MVEAGVPERVVGLGRAEGWAGHQLQGQIRGGDIVGRRSESDQGPR